jgi:hypothetical protein
VPLAVNPSPSLGAQNSQKGDENSSEQGCFESASNYF